MLAALISVIAYLATLSDLIEDESIYFVDIDSYIAKEDASMDIDNLSSTFDGIHPNPYRFFDKEDFQAKIDSIKSQLPDSLTILNF